MFPKAALLLGLAVVGIHVRTIQKEFVDISKDHDYFAVSVEFAVAWFNRAHEEEHAYKLLEVRRAQQKNWTMIYLMDLELGRTICKKYDQDIDNCPLQEGPEEKKGPRAPPVQRCSQHSSKLGPVLTARLAQQRTPQTPMGPTLLDGASIQSWAPASRFLRTRVQEDAVLPVSCTFIVDSRPWFTQFTLLNSTCQQKWGEEFPAPTAAPFLLKNESLES
eukprot:XP_023979326.1 probable cystatin-16 [Physeter catodon]